MFIPYIMSDVTSWQTLPRKMTVKVSRSRGGFAVPSNLEGHCAARKAEAKGPRRSIGTKEPSPPLFPRRNLASASPPSVRPSPVRSVRRDHYGRCPAQSQNYPTFAYRFPNIFTNLSPAIQRLLHHRGLG